MRIQRTMEEISLRLKAIEEEMIKPLTVQYNAFFNEWSGLLDQEYSISNLKEFMEAQTKLKAGIHQVDSFARKALVCFNLEIQNKSDFLQIFRLLPLLPLNGKTETIIDTLDQSNRKLKGRTMLLEHALEDLAEKNLSIFVLSSKLLLKPLEALRKSQQESAALEPSL